MPGTVDEGAQSIGGRLREPTLDPIWDMVYDCRNANAKALTRMIIAKRMTAR